MSKEIDRKLLKEFREAFSKSVASLEKQFGISMSLGTIRFDPDNFRATLTAVKTDLDTSGMSVEESKFKRDLKTYGSLFGVTESLYHKIITDRGKRLQFLGIASSRSKYPYVFKNLNNQKTILFTSDILPILTKKGA